MSNVKQLYVTFISLFFCVSLYGQDFYPDESCQNVESIVISTDNFILVSLAQGRPRPTEHYIYLIANREFNRVEAFTIDMYHRSYPLVTDDIVKHGYKEQYDKAIWVFKDFNIDKQFYGL